jgi:hypothetical protein
MFNLWHVTSIFTSLYLYYLKYKYSETSLKRNLDLTASCLGPENLVSRGSERQETASVYSGRKYFGRLLFLVGSFDSNIQHIM